MWLYRRHEEERMLPTFDGACSGSEARASSLLQLQPLAFTSQPTQSTFSFALAIHGRDQAGATDHHRDHQKQADAWLTPRLPLWLLERLPAPSTPHTGAARAHREHSHLKTRVEHSDGPIIISFGPELGAAESRPWTCVLLERYCCVL